MPEVQQKIEAEWTIELNCDCPSCKERVNLLDYADFWDGRNLDIGNTRQLIEVVCPECDHEFEVETVY